MRQKPEIHLFTSYENSNRIHDGQWHLLVMWMGRLFERIIFIKAQPNKKIAISMLSILTIQVQAKIHIVL